MKTKLLYIATAFAAALLLLAGLYYTQPAQAASRHTNNGGASADVSCISLSKPAAAIFQAKHPLDFLMK